MQTEISKKQGDLLLHFIFLFQKYKICEVGVTMQLTGLDLINIVYTYKENKVILLGPYFRLWANL